MTQQVASEIRTFINAETGEPTVVINVFEVASKRTVLPIAFTPEEARETAKYIIEAAEAIEQDAHMIASMRSLKFTEHQIGLLISAVRMMRGAPLNSATLPESQEGAESD